MAFSVNYGRNGGSVRRSAGAANAGRILTSAFVLFALFCIYDYSPYGEGYVSAGLGTAQHAFQGFMQRFRVRI